MRTFLRRFDALQLLLFEELLAPVFVSLQADLMPEKRCFSVVLKLEHWDCALVGGGTWMIRTGLFDGHTRNVNLAAMVDDYGDFSAHYFALLIWKNSRLFFTGSSSS